MNTTPTQNRPENLIAVDSHRGPQIKNTSKINKKLRKKAKRLHTKRNVTYANDPKRNKEKSQHQPWINLRAKQHWKPKTKANNIIQWNIWETDKSWIDATYYEFSLSSHIQKKKKKHKTPNFIEVQK